LSATLNRGLTIIYSESSTWVMPDFAPLSTKSWKRKRNFEKNAKKKSKIGENTEMESPPSLKSEAAVNRRMSRKVIGKREEEAANDVTDRDLVIAEDRDANRHAVERGGGVAEIGAQSGNGAAAEAVRHAEAVETRDVDQGHGRTGGHDRHGATKIALTDDAAVVRVTKIVAENRLVREVARSNNVVEVSVVRAVEVAAVRFRRGKTIRQTIRRRQNQRLKTITTIMIKV
jgi:hypothetical protein